MQPQNRSRKGKNKGSYDSYDDEPEVELASDEEEEEEKLEIALYELYDSEEEQAMNVGF